MLEHSGKFVIAYDITQMHDLLFAGDVLAMRTFMDECPECNDSGKWIEKADFFMFDWESN